MHANLSEFLALLRREGELLDIEVPVNPYLEIAEIHRRVIDEQGPALLFHRVEGSTYPVVTNLFGTMRRVQLAFGVRPEQFVHDAVRLVHQISDGWRGLWSFRHRAMDVARIGTRTIDGRKAPIVHRCLDGQPLRGLPALTSWSGDGGPFLTLPLVYTEHPETRQHNLGMYRMHVYDANTTGMHWQIHKGGGFHHFVAEQRNEPLPVTVYLGGPPALIVAAIAPLPENVPELLLTSLLLGQRLPLTNNPYGGHRLIAEAEFAIEGVVMPHERRTEGPFGDHYGYYSLAHEFPVFRVHRLWHRRDAVYPATIVGKPRQEDYFIGEYLQKLLSPIFPLVMPSVRDLWTYAETGFHPLAAAIVKERYQREALTVAWRILGEGQLTLTKVLFLTDQSIDLANFSALLTAVLERIDPESDLRVIDKTAHDTLDYTGDRLNHGSKAVLIGIGAQRRTLPSVLPEGIDRIPQLREVRMYVPGCAVVSGPTFTDNQRYAEQLLTAWRDIDPTGAWPLIVLVDDASWTVRDQTSFLWSVFTRCNPATDFYAPTIVRRHHVAYTLPLVIDARMKPGYPDELIPHEAIVERVNTRWRSYFPQKGRL